MTDQVFSRRLQQLINQLESHPNKDEIIELALQQLADDDYKVQQH
jgi:hypothetical protein